MLIKELTGARCGQPFEHLGLVANPDGGGLVLRAWLPGAHSVDIKELGSDKVIATMLQTGLDMRDKYKETSQGGLAVSVVEC